MKLLCLGMIFLGALIMSFSLYFYYRTLKMMRSQNYEEKSFKGQIYNACFAMMCFFLIGYIIVGVDLLGESLNSYQLLISAIFFFGAVFVCCMVQVQRRLTKTIMKQTLDIIESMINTIEAKDKYTKGHSEHVKNLVALIYSYLPNTLRHNLNIYKLKDAAMLHDIGKIKISDSILNKPGSLTPEEKEVIRQHPGYGREMLQDSCYRDLSEWILYHHERIDGQGFHHITEENIPYESKIIALADTFSALSTDRVYRKKFTYEEAISILKDVAGTQLDKELVQIFLSISKEEVEHAMPRNIEE